MPCRRHSLLHNITNSVSPNSNFHLRLSQSHLRFGSVPSSNQASTIMKLEELCFSHHFSFLILFLLILHTVHAIAHPRPQPASDFQQDEEAQYLKLGPELSRPIAVLIVLLLFIFFIIVFFSVYLRHYLELNAATHDVLRSTAGVDRFGMRNGLDPAVIRTFPVVAHSTIKETKIGKWSLECAVCLSEFQDYETLRLLPKCGHVFHPDCIDAWLASCATCPICRAKLAAAGEIISAEEFVTITVVDEADRNGDGNSEAVERSNSGELVCEMELGGGGGEKCVDVGGGGEEVANLRCG